MERLTETVNGVVTYIGSECHYSVGLTAGEIPTGVNREMMRKLAAYEDTGYKPTEIKSLEAEWNACRSALDSYRAVGTVEEFRAALRRTAEHDKAREEGRLVELPCKVGDPVYWMWTDGEGRCEGPIYEDSVYEVCVTKNGVELSRGPHDGGLGMIGVHPPRAVFLTRQEAEAALGGGEGES